jgi:hypothetical protein
VKFPDSVFSLHFGEKFNQPGLKCPKELTNLMFKSGFEQSLDSIVFNKKLQVLYLSAKYNKSKASVPKKVKIDISEFPYDFLKM